jgi:plasmid stabilization system protein ParE
MTRREIIAAWNAQSDYRNSWHHLGEDEKLEWAMELEREACAKRRGVLAFCPYTGRPRHPSDIASDPHGILILVPDQPLRGIKP